MKRIKPSCVTPSLALDRLLYHATTLIGPLGLHAPFLVVLDILPGNDSVSVETTSIQLPLVEEFLF